MYRGGKNRNYPIEPGLRAFIIRYPRSRVTGDPEGREACAPFFIFLEGRNLSVSCRIPSYSMTRGGGNKPVKKPFLVRWRGDDIATCDIHEFPDAVHVSRLLTVPKDKLNVRSIFDPSELNSFCGPPKRSSIHKRMHRAHLYLRRVNLSPRPASRVEPSGWRKGTSWLVRLSLLCSVRVTWAYS